MTSSAVPRPIFRDRVDAGRRLAAEVTGLALDLPVVLGLPRGGVPVAAAVAQRLGAPLDVVVVRKIGAPRNAELGLGAVGEGDVEVLSATMLRRLGLDRDGLVGTIDRERARLAEQVLRFRGGRDPVEVRGGTAIVVDDGLATGSTASAAVVVLRRRGAARVVVAVPVGARAAVDRLRDEADEVVCLHAPPGFRSVGAAYRDFTQVSDEEVVRLLGGG